MLSRLARLGRSADPCIASSLTLAHLMKDERCDDDDQGLQQPQPAPVLNGAEKVEEALQRLRVDDEQGEDQPAQQDKILVSRAQPHSYGRVIGWRRWRLQFRVRGREFR